MATVYFIYSAEQEKFMRSIEESMGRRFRVGTVIDKGSKKAFTEKSYSPRSKYSDSKVVAEGEEALMKYTLPEGVI